MNFYPRSPCGERHRSPRLVSDDIGFLSTLSLRRATGGYNVSIDDFVISIHALLAESDNTALPVRAPIQHFYPRSPCGERPHGALGLQAHQGHFYPRSPCGERRQAMYKWGINRVISIHALLAESDCSHQYHRRGNQISIHALLAESDSTPRAKSAKPTNFYPRSPCGERRQSLDTFLGNVTISIHALLAESDSKSAQNSGALLRI